MVIIKSRLYFGLLVDGSQILHKSYDRCHNFSWCRFILMVHMFKMIYDGRRSTCCEMLDKSSDYWLGASNGREISWQWVQDKVITMDVNQTAALEGDALYQQVKAYFKGETYRKYIHPYLTPYNIDNIDEVLPHLVPFSDVDAYMEGRAAGNFVTDINDPKFKDQKGFE